MSLIGHAIYVSFSVTQYMFHQTVVLAFLELLVRDCLPLFGRRVRQIPLLAIIILRLGTICKGGRSGAKIVVSARMQGWLSLGVLVVHRVVPWCPGFPLAGPLVPWLSTWWSLSALIVALVVSGCLVSPVVAVSAPCGP